MAAGIYIHIPFCKQKCLYCDFISSYGCDEDMKLYKDALINEIESTDIAETVDSVFFGGGTPSIFATEYIEEIMHLLVDKYRINLKKAEITIEANPGTITYDKLFRYKKAGINRLSIGLQSANDKELKILGRIHNYEMFLKSYEAARKAGFDNINIDLMSAIPTQTFESYTETLSKIILLNPEHISAYSLIVEEGTPFYEKYSEDKEFYKELPDEETDRKMYHYTKELLSKYDYKRYEISNYAKKGFECRHNIKYWSRDDYYGFGTAAASLVNNTRYTNITDRNKYINFSFEKNKIRTDIQEIEIQEQMEEYMILGLRKTQGVSLDDFRMKFNINLEEVYGKKLEKLVRQNVCEYDDNYFRLTEYGLDVSNTVLVEFMN